MKNKKILSLIILTSILFTSCSNAKKIIPEDKYQITEEKQSSYTLQTQSPEETKNPTDTNITTTEESNTETTSDETTKEETTSSEINSSTTTTTTTKPIITQQTTTTIKPNTSSQTTMTPPTTGTYSTLNYDIQKGIWISFLESEIKSAYKTEFQFRSQIASAYAKAKAMGINTVYVHARSHGDAFYDSEYYPWSHLSAGKIGNAPSYDPFKIMVDEAHKQGLSFHAWINPMRGPTESNMQALALNKNDNSIIKQWYNDPQKNGTYLVKHKVGKTTNYYLNPAYPEVQDLINKGITEIISKYKVDAIHIDDYFYPTTSDTFDKSAYNKYGGGQNLADWRRSNTDKMVRSMYSTVKRANSNVLFGISPAGNISNNYNSLYADIAKWCSTTGYMDYVIPQLYWGFEHSSSDFKKACSIWSDTVKSSSIDLIIGLGTYKVCEKKEDDFIDNPYIMSQQIAHSKTLSKYKGIAFFRYENLMDNALNADRQNITDQLK